MTCSCSATRVVCFLRIQGPLRSLQNDISKRGTPTRTNRHSIGKSGKNGMEIWLGRNADSTPKVFFVLISEFLTIQISNDFERNLKTLF